MMAPRSSQRRRAGEAEPPPWLVGFDGDLNVDARREPLQWQEIGANGRSACATFGDSGFESLVLAVSLEGSRGLRISATFDTDYRRYLGEIEETSSSHRRGNELQLDLSVRRLDGSGQVERWRCKVKLR